MPKIRPNFLSSAMWYANKIVSSQHTWIWGYFNFPLWGKINQKKKKTLMHIWIPLRTSIQFIEAQSHLLRNSFHPLPSLGRGRTQYGKYYESESHSVVSNSLWPHALHSPWNSPGQNTGVGSLSLLQGIFPTQGSNPGPQHCKQILYQLSLKQYGQIFTSRRP